MTVPRAALVSMAMACDPLRMPSRSSNWPVPRSALVSARPSFTMPSSQLKMVRPVGVSNRAFVARLERPLPLLTNSLSAIAVHCSKKIGSVL